MRIALVIFRANPARGGAERYTVDLANSLALRGHHAAILSSEFGPPIEQVRFVPIGASGLTRSRKYRTFLESLQSHLDREKYDVVHAMLPVPRCDIYHPHAGMAAGMGSAWPFDHFKRLAVAAVEADLLNGPQPPIVLVLSDYMKSSILQHFPKIESRLRKLFNAVDLERFSPNNNLNARNQIRSQFGIPSTDTVGLMIAQDFARKGLETAIQSLSLLPNPPILLVVGRDKSQSYERMAQKLGIGARVIFSGSTDKPADFYHAADFFLLPTIHDPCSLVVLESLAMGVPVISTQFNGACEIMQNGMHGFVLDDPRDAGKLSQAIQKMLDDQLRQSMRYACLELRPQLSFDAHVDHLLKIYRELAVWPVDRPAPRS